MPESKTQVTKTGFKYNGITLKIRICQNITEIELTF